MTAASLKQHISLRMLGQAWHQAKHDVLYLLTAVSFLHMRLIGRPGAYPALAHGCRRVRLS